MIWDILGYFQTLCLLSSLYMDRCTKYPKMVIHMAHIKYNMAYGVDITPLNSFKSRNSKSKFSSDAIKEIFWNCIYFRDFSSYFRKEFENLTILQDGNTKSKWNHMGGNLSFYTTQKRRTKPIKKVVISKLSHVTLYAFENYKLHFEVIIWNTRGCVIRKNLFR